MTNKLIHMRFNLLPDYPTDVFASRLVKVCSAILDYNQFSSEVLDEVAKFESFLLEKLPKKVINFDRSEFRGVLESHPFATTLLLMRDGEDAKTKQQLELHSAILARLFIDRSHDDYDAYLAFYRAFLAEDTSLPFSTSFITLASSEEIQIEVLKVGEFRNARELKHFARFMQPRKSRELESKPHPFFTAQNQHLKTVELNNAVHTELISATTEEGENVGSFLKITPQLDQLSSQEFAQFAKKVSGLQRALYTAELRPAWTNLAATPKELAAFISIASPYLLKSNYRPVYEDAAPLLVFFLKLLGIQEPTKLIIINLGSPKFKSAAPRADSVAYELKRSKHGELKDARLTLNANLITVQGPSDATQSLHYYSQKTLTLFLSEPFTSLLECLITRTPPEKRLEHSLGHAFEFSEDDYRTWFAKNLKNSQLRNLSITKASLEGAFFNFAKESVPEVSLNFLAGQPCVQHHYISQKRERIVEQVDFAWRNFMRLVGLTRITSMRLPSPRDHDEAGSQLTIRREISDALYKAILENATQLQSSDLSDHELYAFNLIALFIYLRIATTVGLRPVEAPLPNRQHYSSAHKIMSVADKRVHHRKERRMIVLTSSLCELIDAHLQVSDLLSGKRGIPRSESIVCALEHGEWQNFSKTYVEKMLQIITGEDLNAHSLRHVAASRFLEPQSKYSQSRVNLLLNHARASVYPLSIWSTESALSISSRQRDLLEAYDSEYLQPDLKALEILRLLDEGFSK